MSCWYMFLKPHQTTKHSNVIDQLKYLTIYIYNCLISKVSLAGLRPIILKHEGRKILHGKASLQIL